MKRVICAAFCLCLAIPMNIVVAQQRTMKTGDLTDPIAILKKVDAAAKAVKGVRYKGSIKGTGAGESRVPTVEGTVIMSGWVSGTLEKFRCDVKVQRPQSSEVMEITAGSDGEDFYVVDHKAKKAYVDLDPEVIGSTGRPALLLRMLEFLHPTPFSDEINAGKQELTGSKKIGGEDCYEVRVVYAGGRAEAIWHFSKRDFLPRARHDIYTTPSGEKGGQQRILTDLVVDPKFDKDAFKLTTPKGYTKTDDFAP